MTVSSGPAGHAGSCRDPSRHLDQGRRQIAVADRSVLEVETKTPGRRPGPFDQVGDRRPGRDRPGAGSCRSSRREDRASGRGRDRPTPDGRNGGPGNRSDRRCPAPDRAARRTRHPSQRTHSNVPRGAVPLPWPRAPGRAGRRYRSRRSRRRPSVSAHGGVEALLDRGRDQVGGVVEPGGEALDVDPIQRVEPDHVEDLAGQRTAGDHQESIALGLMGLHLRSAGGPAPALRRSRWQPRRHGNRRRRRSPGRTPR